MAKKETPIINSYNPELVVMRNPIITTKLNFTPLQAQIMLEMIARIHPENEDFSIIKINVRDFAEKVGIEHSHIYSEIDKATHGMNKWVYIVDENDKHKSVAKVTLLTKVKYFEKKGYVELKFHEDLKPYLLQIKESGFFSYHIEATRHLKNYAFIKLYWLLVSWKSVQTKVFLLEELKQTLELDGQYAVYQDFKKRVLQPARAAFIKYGEIYFDYEEIRENPKSKRSAIEKIKFTILPNPNWKQRKRLNFADIQPVEPDMDNPEIQQVLKDILGLSKDISEVQAMQFIRNHTIYKPTDILSEIIAIRKVKAKGKDVIDHLAALSNAVKNKYNTGIHEEQKKKRQEQEELKIINTWYDEFEQLFKEYKFQRSETATEEEIELYKKQGYPLNRQGEPFKEFLGEFVGIYRGEIPTDKDINFTNWVSSRKGKNLQKLDDKWKIVEAAF